MIAVWRSKMERCAKIVNGWKPCLELTIKTSERRQWHNSGVLIVNS